MSKYFALFYRQKSELSNRPHPKDPAETVVFQSLRWLWWSVGGLNQQVQPFLSEQKIEMHGSTKSKNSPDGVAVELPGLIYPEVLRPVSGFEEICNKGF